MERTATTTAMTTRPTHSPVMWPRKQIHHLRHLNPRFPASLCLFPPVRVRARPDSRPRELLPWSDPAFGHLWPLFWRFSWYKGTLRIGSRSFSCAQRPPCAELALLLMIQQAEELVWYHGSKNEDFNYGQGHGILPGRYKLTDHDTL